jgi:hypothetical protein
MITSPIQAATHPVVIWIEQFESSIDSFNPYPQASDSTKANLVYEAREKQREWRKNSNSVKQKHGLPPDYQGFTTRDDVTLSGVPRTPRFLDAIDTFWGIKVLGTLRAVPAVTSAQLKEGLWLDLSQQVHRLKSGKPGGLCTSGLWYSFEADSVLDGRDVLALQGFPDSVSHDDEFSSSEKRHMAGESYNLSTFAIVAYAMHLSPWGPWWR